MKEISKPSKHLVAAALLLNGLALADAGEAPRMPADTEIKQQMQSQRALTRDTLEQAERDKAAVPRITLRDDQVRGGSVDLEDLAKKYDAIKDGRAPETQGPRLFVFVSLSMPKASIERVMAESQKAGAVVVLRGMLGATLRETTTKIRELATKYGSPSIQIDPNKYRTYGVNAVPTTVLAIGQEPSCSFGKCTDPGEFYSVEGDVSLQYALEEMSRLRQGARAHSAKFLAQLKGQALEAGK